jgi:trans-aconitate methyltransferase
MFGLCTNDKWRGKLADVPGLRPVDDPVDYLTTMADAGLHADTWEVSYTVVLDCGNGRNGAFEHVKATTRGPARRVSAGEHASHPGGRMAGAA